MGNETNRGRIAKAAIAAITAALLCLALASTALAGPPSHPRTPAEDISGLDHACGTAVDTEGDVYASSAGEDKIKVFDPDHALIAQIANANGPCGLAVNSRGELLVAEQGTGNVVRFVPDQYPLSATPVYSPAQPVDSSGEAAGISIDASDDTLLIAKGDRIDAFSASEVQQVTIGGASGGSFKLRFGGQETTAIAFDASAEAAEEALEDLAAIGDGGVSVSVLNSGSNRIYWIEFIGARGYADLPQAEAISSLTPGTAAARTFSATSGGLGIDESQRIEIKGATGGSFKLKFEGQETASIALNAPARKAEGAGSVEAALEALSNIAPGDVSVVAAVTDSSASAYAITFEAALAAKDVPQIEVITGLLPNEVQKVTVNASAGAYNLVATTGIGRGSATLGSKIVTGVSTSFGAFRVGDAITGPGMPLGTTITAIGSGTLEISANANASDANKELTATETTAAIEFNAFANTGEGAGSIEAALEALPALDTADVSVTGGPGGPGGATPYLVSFEGAYGGRNVPQMSRKKAGITGDATVTTQTEGASISSSTPTQGWSGRIGQGDLGDATGVGVYTYGTGAPITRRYVFSADSETDEVKVFYSEQLRTLKLRETIAGVDEDRNPETPDQELGFGPEGTSVGVDPANGHFLLFDADHSAVDEFEATGQFLDQIADPGLEDAEPTGLAVRPHRNEVQWVHIEATGGSFKLEFEGAQTGEIPIHFGEFGFGLAATEVQEALEELPTVGKGSAFVNGADAMPAGGNFTIGFKGDLGDRDIEQLGVDGSGLTGGPHTATVETLKQGRGPGRIYASVGTGSGAKLLAFGPLVTPSRPLVPELSHVLTGATSVAVDRFGNVYASTPTKVQVYSPVGEELTEFALPEASGVGIDVDGEGNLYTLEGPSNAQTMTYYAPSEHPPTTGTAYSRHTPALIPSASSLELIAVNPANDHVFVSKSSPSRVYEFDSAKEGSTLLNTEFAEGVAPTNIIGLGVYGAEGSVYASENSGKVFRTDSLGFEILGAIDSKDPSRINVANPNLAVDQSNGHALLFEAGTNVQEYEPSGAFVGEFGGVTHTFGTGHDIAIDNACALHDPPLTEATTPTCAEFDPANGTLYVAHVDVNKTQFPYDITAYGPLSYGEAPFATTGVANGIGAAAATLNGAVDPRAFDLDECAFEYLEDEEYKQNLEDEDPAFQGASTIACVETPAEIGNGSEAVDVHANGGGIEPQAKRYRFRLIARNGFGESQGDAALFGPPLLTTKTAQPVFYDEATLRAGIDTSGLPTTYRFEYGLNAGEYTQSTADFELEPGDGLEAIETPVVGLAEATEYHFRIVVENEAKTVEGPDQTLLTQQRSAAQSCPNVEYRTGLSTFLPDCRAYELVTPAETRGLRPVALSRSGSEEGFFNTSPVTQRGPGAGDSVAYLVGGLPGFDGTGRGDGFRAQRGAGDHPAEGWQTDLFGFSFAQIGGGSNDWHGISPDLDYWLMDVAGSQTPSEEAFPEANYLLVPSGQALPSCSPDPEGRFELVGCAGLGTDPAAEGRYVSAAGAHVIFASKAHLEDEAAPVGTSALYDRKAGSPSAEVVSVKPDGSAFGAGENATYLASTENGTAVAFSVAGAIYLHREGQTFEIVAAPNTFDGISEDGRRVFYMDVAFGGGGLGPSPPAGLYACDTQTGPCAGLGAHAPTQIAANSNFVNVSADGSHAFVTSEDALTPPEEENGNGEHAEAGEHNLYAWDDTGLSFVATLADQDLVSFGGEVSEHLLFWERAILGQGTPGNYSGRDLSPTRSTLDGGALVFQSHARLTSYDNGGHGEIYRYAGGQLDCVSCDPSGAPADSDDRLQSRAPNNGVTFAETLIPNLTADGQRVFFQSEDRLLPEDANSTVDVYEWIAQGAGSCERSGGCLALISSGQGEEPNYLYAMTADGSDVFFGTPEKLVTQDVAGSPSIYDARVNGGISDRPAAAPCQGDACQGQGTPAPALPTPSSTGQGSGNVSEAVKRPSCAKGKRRVKGRCVKKPAKKKSKQHKQRSHRQANHDRGASR